jgi:AraC-like DNA-binding protein
MPPENKFTNRHTIASYFAQAHLQNGILLGANEQQVLTLAGLTHVQLKQPKSRVLATQLASIVKSCWRVSGDELLGFTEQKVKVGMFALLAEHLITCKTLEGVLAHSAAFYNLTGDQLQFNLENNGSQVRLSVNVNFKSSNENTSANSLLIELLLLIFHRFPSWLVGRVIPLSHIHVKHAKPTHHEEYRLMFPCPCIYQSTHNTLVFDAKYLHLPVVQTPDELVKYVNHIPLQWFKKQSYYDTCSAQVMRILESSLLDKGSNLENVATKLNMTSRTLRRKLIVEGSRFQQLKDNTRRDKAISLFEQADLTIAEIGLAVGFTELATFSRAFKHWTGVSPNTYRNYDLLTTSSSEKNE